jgi:hypothetical protein
MLLSSASSAAGSIPSASIIAVTMESDNISAMVGSRSIPKIGALLINARAAVMEITVLPTRRWSK